MKENLIDEVLRKIVFFGVFCLINCCSLNIDGISSKRKFLLRFRFIFFDGWIDDHLKI